jgi:integrase
VRTDSVLAQQALTAIATDKASVFKSNPPGHNTGYRFREERRSKVRNIMSALTVTRSAGHTLRHSFGTLMKANGEDVKTIQELLRHANFKVTMDVYTQAVTDVMRTAHSRGARQIMGTRVEKDDE